MQKVVYLSHAITAPYDLGGRVWKRHESNVGSMAEEVVRAGYAVVVPHVLPGLTHRTAMRQDHTLVEIADAVMVHESEWTKDSRGVAQEVRWAREMGKPVVYSVHELKEKCPK